jgi:hypothetical protein
LNQFAVELQEIRDLIERSSDAINPQDWPAFEAMMTDDVVWERMPPTPWTLEGRATVHSFLSRNSGKIDILCYAISGSAIDVADRTHAVARSTRRTIAPRFEHDVESPTRVFERATSR